MNSPNQNNSLLKAMSTPELLSRNVSATNSSSNLTPPNAEMRSFSANSQINNNPAEYIISGNNYVIIL